MYLEIVIIGGKKEEETVREIRRIVSKENPSGRRDSAPTRRTGSKR